MTSREGFCNCVYSCGTIRQSVLSWQFCVSPNVMNPTTFMIQAIEDWPVLSLASRLPASCSSSPCPCRISLVFLAFVVLLCHQWVVEPGTTQAAVLARLAVIGQRLPRGRGRVCGLRGGRGWLCTEQNIHSSSINIHQYRWAYEPIQYQNKHKDSVDCSWNCPAGKHTDGSKPNLLKSYAGQEKVSACGDENSPLS